MTRYRGQTGEEILHQSTATTHPRQCDRKRTARSRPCPERRHKAAISHSHHVRLFRAADAGVLPRDGDALVISAKSRVRSVAVAEFQRLVFVEPDRTGRADARTGLARFRIGDAVQSNRSPEPEVSIQRHPRSRFPVVTQVSFKRPNRLF